MKNVNALISPLSVGSGETALPYSSILVINQAVVGQCSFMQARRLDSCTARPFEKYCLDVSIKLFKKKAGSWCFILLESAHHSTYE